MSEYYKTSESVQEYINAAKGFSGKDIIEKLKEITASNSTLLELGSGPGTDWKILNEYFDVVGSDFSDEFLKHLKKEFPKGKFINVDASSLEVNMKFDVIYSNKVLHHLSNNQLMNSIKRQSELLNSKGIVCHTIWEGKGDEVFNDLFVNYHTKEELESLFSNNYEVLFLEGYKEFDEGDSLLLIARKKN